MKFFRFFLCSIFLLASQNALAQNDFGQSMQQIALGKGPITKEEYDKFWQQLGATRPEDKKRIIDAMYTNFLVTQQYQKEIWQCAEKAWLLQSVPKCDGADQRFKIIEAEMKKYDQVKTSEQMKNNSERLLRAAAKRSDYKITNDAAPLHLTIETIRETKANIELMLNRFEQVLRVRYEK